MYSRSYIGNPPAKIPENYDGIAMSEPEIREKADTYSETNDSQRKADTPALNPWESESSEKEEPRTESVGAFSSLGGTLGGVLGGIKLPFFGEIKMPKIGTEEILILIAAAYLFFSKDGDKECAIILILLLFVT